MLCAARCVPARAQPRRHTANAGAHARTAPCRRRQARTHARTHTPARTRACGHACTRACACMHTYTRVCTHVRSPRASGNTKGTSPVARRVALRTREYAPSPRISPQSKSPGLIPPPDPLPLLPTLSRRPSSPPPPLSRRLPPPSLSLDRRRASRSASAACPSGDGADGERCREAATLSPKPPSPSAISWSLPAGSSAAHSSEHSGLPAPSPKPAPGALNSLNKVDVSFATLLGGRRALREDSVCA